MRVLSGIHAIIFDVYGTLLISHAGELGSVNPKKPEKAMRDALLEGGFELRSPTLNANAILEREIRLAHEERGREGIEFPEVEIRGIWKTLLAALRKEGRIAGEIGEDTTTRVALAFETLVNPVWPMPGARDILSALKAGDYIMGMVSNAQFYTPLILHALFEANYPDLGLKRDCCIWSYRLGEAKPSPRLFHSLRESLHRHGISPPETLVVGNDIRNDIYPARQSGFRTALFAGDRRSLRLREGELFYAEVKPDLVLTDLRQILECI